MKTWLISAVRFAVRLFKSEVGPPRRISVFSEVSEEKETDFARDGASQDLGGDGEA
ncbi:UNVERIFIED_CONTAM: hypothetical protein Sangu_1860700 [Sesamum angustifolium]|uniref:Uncharacterized protein n=1 Tax=Sesamum angustifolium TaxID=2727405 RepID=A0AAW2M8K7_9LAMI